MSESGDGNDKTESGEAEGDEGEGVPLLDRGQGDAVQTLQKVHRTCFRNVFNLCFNENFCYSILRVTANYY